MTATTALTLTYEQAEEWLRSRLYRMHLGMVATERALDEERKLTAYLSAENAILRAELGTARTEQTKDGS